MQGLTLELSSLSPKLASRSGVESLSLVSEPFFCYDLVPPEIGLWWQCEWAGPAHFLFVARDVMRRVNESAEGVGCIAMNPLEELLERTVEGLGYELCDLELANRGKMLRLFIDKKPEVQADGRADGRITVEDCERVTRQLQRVLPVEGIDYDRLEVSSPGLDRRLRKPADFSRFAGSEVEIRLRALVSGRRRLVGLLRGLAGEMVELEVGGAPMSVDLSNVERARLVPKI